MAVSPNSFCTSCGINWIELNIAAPVTSIITKQVPTWRLPSKRMLTTGSRLESSHGMNAISAAAEMHANVTMKFDSNQSLRCPS